ncbi:hypothetical protein [uncultured Aquimonas sp.]|uniref:hypothetical protein n=1 Tax=uncultured Aquimonas sp. TaxID=385483 RepID=UPI00086831B9|nr:hypothetical protein [uncultured Aquimonas sp.]ODU44957.1 MAG: hypothetical protein ABS96_16425 [Xanthomonadaceae bacterium SCN 69-123]
MSKRGDRGNAYFICWEHKAGGLRAWLRDRPSLSVEAEDREEAEEELGMQVMEWNGDGEACFEWEIHDNALINEYRSLSYNDSVEVLNPREELFAQGVCGRCGSGIGSRNEVAAVLARSPMSDIFCLERPFPKDIYPTRTCVSERFLELLSADEVARLEPRAVVAPPRVRMRYYEICGKPVAQARALVGCPFLNQVHQSWQCTACGQHAFMQATPHKSGTIILSEQDLGSQSGEMFLYCKGGTRGPAPVFSLTRWKALQQAAGKRLKGLLSGPALVVPEALCMKELDLPDYVV